MGAGLLAFSAGLSAHADGDRSFGGHGVKRVLLISIDGMHAVDFANCASGLAGVNSGAPYCPNLAVLGADGRELSWSFHVRAVRFVPRTDGAGDRGVAA